MYFYQNTPTDFFRHKLIDGPNSEQMGDHWRPPHVRPERSISAATVDVVARLNETTAAMASADVRACVAEALEALEAPAEGANSAAEQALRAANKWAEAEPVTAHVMAKMAGG